MEELLKKFLSKTLNLTENEFASLYEDEEKKTFKSDALDTLLAKSKAKIDRLKDNKDALTEKYNDGAKAGKAKALGAYEKQLKEDFKIESDLVGIALVKEIVSKNSKVEMDVDKIKLSQTYLDLESKSISKEKHNEVVKDFADYKTGKEVAEKQGILKADGRTIFMGLKPVLSSDKTKAENQTKNFLKIISAGNFEIKKDTEHILLKADGSREEDEQGNHISFKDYVTKEANLSFDFEVQDGKGNSGNSNDDKPLPDEKKKKFVIPDISTEGKYQQALVSAKSREESVAIMEAYKK